MEIAIALLMIIIIAISSLVTFIERDPLEDNYDLFYNSNVLNVCSSK